MADSALSQNASLLSSIASLIPALTGSSGTVTKSGGTTTQTQQTVLDEDAVNALIKKMMEDSSTGLAATASGSKQVGMYNSTAQQQLTNDLTARVASNVAAASAPTTTTTTSTPITQTTSTDGLLSGSNSNLILPALGIGLLMKKNDQGQSGFDSLISSIFGSGSQSNADYSNIADYSSNIASVLSSSANAGGSLNELGSSALSTDTSNSWISDALTSVIGGTKDIWDSITETVSGWF